MNGDGTGSVRALKLGRSFGLLEEEPIRSTFILQTPLTDKPNLSSGRNTSINQSDPIDALQPLLFRILKDLRTENPRKSGEGRTDSAVSPGKKNKRRVLEGWVIPKDKDKTE